MKNVLACPGLRRRPPLLLRRLLDLPAQVARTWPCYTLPHRTWTTPLNIATFLPPAPGDSGDCSSGVGVRGAARHPLEWVPRPRHRPPWAAVVDDLTGEALLFRQPPEATIE